jgi:hypothetical protein
MDLPKGELFPMMMGEREMNLKKIVTTQPVDIALRTLAADEVGQVHAWFDSLRNWDNDETVRRNSQPLGRMPDIYVLRTTTDIRIFFRLEPDTITILDIARKPTVLTSGHLSGAT